MSQYQVLTRAFMAVTPLATTVSLILAHIGKETFVARKMTDCFDTAYDSTNSPQSTRTQHLAPAPSHSRKCHYLTLFRYLYQM